MKTEIGKGLFAERSDDGSVRLWLEDASNVDVTLSAEQFAQKIAEITPKAEKKS